MRVIVLRISNRKFVIRPETILFITAFLKYCGKGINCSISLASLHLQ